MNTTDIKSNNNKIVTAFNSDLTTKSDFLYKSFKLYESTYQ